MARNLVVNCLVIGAALLSYPAQATSPKQAMALSWSTGDRESMSKSFPDIVSVNEFIQAILPKAQNGDPLPTCDRYTFANLGGGTLLQLICSLSDGVRFHPTILVVSKAEGRFATAEAYDGGAMDVPDLKDVVVDVNGHGRMGLLIPRRLGSYKGAQPVPLVYDIYDFKKGQLREADLQFGGYYREKLLPRLRSKLNADLNLPKSGYSDIDGKTDAEIATLRVGISAMDKMLTSGHIP